MKRQPPIARPARNGRSAQTVRKHLEEAAASASSFLEPVGLSAFGELVGLAHDFGKNSERFQNYIVAPEDGKKGGDHSTAGAQFIWNAWKDKSAIANMAAQIAALCVASHHGGLMDCLSPKGEDVFLRRMEKSGSETNLPSALENTEQSILVRLKAILGADTVPERLRELLGAIAGNTGKGPLTSFAVGLLCRMVFSALIDADRMSAAGRGASPKPDWDILLKRLEAKLAEFDRTDRVNRIRVDISQACLDFASRGKGLYKLTVPTGGGKTLSSLRYALEHAKLNGMSRILYVIPYTSIIEQNAQEARSILERPGEPPLVLEHHASLMQGKDSDENKLLGENWDAPVIFTTSVQLLNALFDGSARSVRRMHRLADAVVVFDEIQTLPIKTVHLFNNAVNFLVETCGTTVVLCTATQPLLDRVDKEKGAIRFTESGHACEMAPPSLNLFRKLKRVEVENHCASGKWTVDEMAAFILDKTAQSGTFLAVTNTRKWARALYEACKQDDDKTFHLSAAMCPEHRSDVLARVKERIAPDNQAPTLLISTQLIEAGVDVDFNGGLRFKAGWDSIAQTAGRINRNGRNPSGVLYIVEPDDERIQSLNDIRVGKTISGRVMEEFRQDPSLFSHDFLGPELMALYYRYYFYDRADEMTYRVEEGNGLDRPDSLLSLLSDNALSVNEYHADHGAKPPFHLCQSFKTAGKLFRALDSQTQTVVVPYGEAGRGVVADLCSPRFDPEERRQLLRRAQRFSVNLYPYEKSRLGNAVMETYPDSGVFFLDDQYYNHELGVTEEPSAEMPVLIG